MLPESVYSYYGLQSIDGYDALEIDAYARALEPYRQSPFRDTGGRVPAKVHEMLDRFNVKYLVTAPGRQVSGEGIQLKYDGPDGRVYSNGSAWPRAFWVSTADFDRGLIAPGPWPVTVALKRAAESEFFVDAPEDGYLCVLDSLFPGWVASVDDVGEPIVPLLEAFRAVRVTAGSHRVRMLYRPASFRIGAWISLLSFLGAVGLACVTQLRANAKQARGASTL